MKSVKTYTVVLHPASNNTDYREVTFVADSKRKEYIEGGVRGAHYLVFELDGEEVGRVLGHLVVSWSSQSKDD